MIDLQLHTTDSDGTWSWDQVLSHCWEMGLTAFAITDHDTMVRCDQIREWAQKHQVMAIPGIEISARDNDETVHILGYFLEGPLDKLEVRLSDLKNSRFSRNRKILEKLRGMGINVTEEEVCRQVGEKGIMTRPHVARILLDKGYVSSIQQAFTRYLKKGAPAYFPKEELSVQEALDLLHGAGAVTSLAHPALLKRSPEELEESFKAWKNLGLDAIEAYYPIFSPQQTSFLRRVASKLGLLVTGGSDFHGENRPKVKIGVGYGELNIPDALMAPLIQRKEEILQRIAKSN